MITIQKLSMGLFTTSLLSLLNISHANTIQLCVFDLLGANGPSMSIAKDYSLFAKQNNVDIQLKNYSVFAQLVQDFDKKACDGIVGDNFGTRKYNNFMATIGAVAAIPDYQVAQNIFQAISTAKLAHKMKHNDYEVVGYMPYGFAYLAGKDRTINSLEKAKGLRVGVLSIDPSQRRMAERVGMKPILMTIDDAPARFAKGEFDIVPVPAIVYEPFEGEKALGPNGGVMNYPMALMTMNFILRQGTYPEGFAQKSRNWFAQKSPQMFRTVKQWDATIPKKMWVQIDEIDRKGYELLAAQLRKEFINNKVYDPVMMNLIHHLRCKNDPSFVECKKK